MESTTNIWYRLGYAWETARLGPAPGDGGRPGREGAADPSGNGIQPGDARNPAASRPWQRLLHEAGGLAGRAVVERAAGRAAAATVDVPRAALAGSGAALATRLMAALVAETGPSPRDPGLGAEMMRGAGQGLALAVLARHLPGGRGLRTALCAAAGYATASRGGLARAVRPIAPPAIRALASLAPADERERGLLEHAAFAAAFLLLYRPSGRGIRQPERSSPHDLPGV